ncbi:MAG: UDP-N-acetylmuramate dehydrogenase [Elusimicrobiaceae bacterium]|nr:UDP-N-acetylmuramate dehydrogenase [Elusimicrobiaceae bacterium]
MDYKQELQHFFGENCLLCEPMGAHTTYRTGGPAEVYVYPQTNEEWEFVLKLARTQNIPLRVLGFGSNILVGSRGIGGITCSTRKMNRILVEQDTVKAQAGAPLDKVCELACKAGLAGMEKLSGIPGSVGGAVFMNAGAYGQETADCLEYFNIIDLEGRPATLTKEDVKFSYRKAEGLPPCIILSAGFALEPGDFTQLLAARNHVQHSRVEKQPLEFPSAGSVFKRPVGDYASRLIDEAGLRGLRVGGAKVSEKHAGFIVNFNHATPEDIKNLMDQVRAKVKEKFGVELELEQILWGGFEA